MQVLRYAIVLAVVGQVRAIAAIEQLQFRIFYEYLHVLLTLLLALFVDEANGFIQGDGHGVGTFSQ